MSFPLSFDAGGDEGSAVSEYAVLTGIIGVVSLSVLFIYFRWFRSFLGAETQSRPLLDEVVSSATHLLGATGGRYELSVGAVLVGVALLVVSRFTREWPGGRFIVRVVVICGCALVVWGVAYGWWNVASGGILAQELMERVTTGILVTLAVLGGFTSVRLLDHVEVAEGAIIGLGVAGIIVACAFGVVVYVGGSISTDLSTIGVVVGAAASSGGVLGSYNKIGRAHV